MGFVEKVGNFFPTKKFRPILERTRVVTPDAKQKVKTAQRTNDEVLVAKQLLIFDKKIGMVAELTATKLFFSRKF